jgi:hypothetical protein
MARWNKSDERRVGPEDAFTVEYDSTGRRLGVHIFGKFAIKFRMILRIAM